MNENRIMYQLKDDEQPSTVNNIFVFVLLMFLLVLSWALYMPGMP